MASVIEGLVLYVRTEQQQGGGWRGLFYVYVTFVLVFIEFGMLSRGVLYVSCRNVYSNSCCLRLCYDYM